MTEVEKTVSERLGFRIETRGNNVGAVIWARADKPDAEGGVRPATTVEISLWNTLLAVWPMEERSE